MDMRSNKKVIIYIILWFILAVVLTGGISIISRNLNHIYHRQMVELSVMHPDQEDELKESYNFYSKESNTYFFKVWLLVLIILVMSFIITYYFQRKKNKIEKHGIITNLILLNEQLKQFIKGNYNGVFFKAASEGASDKTEEWLNIENSLKELGYYFASLKEQMNREENNTKSLITDISHQLKTPLSSLRMSHELAQESELTYEERQDFLNQEEQEIRKLEILLEELINLSRLEYHMIQITPEVLGIRKTLTEAVNQVIMKAYNNNINIQLDMERDVNVCHDPKWTVEAISNVLDNAIKYSEAGSSVSIRVNQLPNILLIEIEDEGMGIPAEELHKIFQRFYRGKKARGLVKEGAGIGLYLARRILEEQGGTIAAKRKQQNGTVFRITLPI